ncbi:MAG TPA: DNA polymerase/3'-5' exonuclease PolX [Thermoanaerobaculia bacterium]|nr:DNA polymerase/3'-5' exonuclease PolX [Thermoanaerobaculia bacterium]
MDKYAVAKTLREISRYLELAEKNRFKSLAFEKAARAVDSIDGDIASFIASGKLQGAPAIGKTIGPMIVELVASGSLPYLEELRRQYPPGIFELLRVPGLGLRKIGTLYESLGIANLDDLERACRNHDLSRLPGLGAKTEQTILEGIGFARSHSGAFLLPVATEMAELVAERLREVAGVEQVVITGSIRRRLEIVKNINLAVSTRQPARLARRLLDESLFDTTELLDGRTLRGNVRGNVSVLIHLATPQALAATLLVTTGSEPFVGALRRVAEKKGVEMTPAGVKSRGKLMAAPDETSIFRRLRLDPIPPELRESSEIIGRPIPALVTRSDLRGTFHVHTTWSDGKATLREMLEAARSRRFSYVGISDHSKAAPYAGGLTEERLREQQAEIEASRPQFPELRIFKGTEADILRDGSIDYGPSVLSSFDFVVASIHSRFKMTGAEMTERMLRALDDPFVTFLGHLTGRRLLTREGYDLDFDRIFARASERGVLIEINGDPNRMEIDWRLLQRALDAGVSFSIHPDAHATRSLDYVDNGVSIARKGAVPKDRIFNTRPVDEIGEYLSRRRARAIANVGATQ